MKRARTKATGLAITLGLIAGCSEPNVSPGYNESFPPSTPTPTTLAETPVQVTNLLGEPLEVTNIPNTYYGPENARGKIEAHQAVMAFCVELRSPASPAVYVETADGQRGYASYLTAGSAKPEHEHPNAGKPQLSPVIEVLRGQLPAC